VDQVKEAVRNGVDYIGIAAVWGTQTKKLMSPVIGVRGVGRMLEELDGTSITVKLSPSVRPLAAQNKFDSQ